MLSYGDVNSTSSAAVTATKLAIPFAHVEGGIRSLDLYNPEEINRRVVDVLAEVIYCCTESDVLKLKRQGYDSQRIIYSVHPRTQMQLENLGLKKKLAASKIEIAKPIGSVEFIRLMAGCNKVLTDSGGVRREAYLLKKPYIVLIELSYFPEIAKAGWKILTEPDAEQIAHLINNFEPTGEYVELFGDGKAYLKIINDLEARFER